MSIKSSLTSLNSVYIQICFLAVYLKLNCIVLYSCPLLFFFLILINPVAFEER